MYTPTNDESRDAANALLFKLLGLDEPTPEEDKIITAAWLGAQRRFVYNSGFRCDYSSKHSFDDASRQTIKQTTDSEYVKACKTLQLSQTAQLTKVQINTQFKLIAKEVHPDLGGNAEDMISLLKAREYLLDKF